MSSGFNQRPSPALVVSLLALFVALGGGALAATSFVGSGGEIHGCVGKSAQLTVLKAGKGCPKGKSSIVWSQRGPRGVQGLHGVPGAPGLGAISVDREFAFDTSIDGTGHDYPFNGFSIHASCSSSFGVSALLKPIDTNHGFYAWGTASNGKDLFHASPSDSSPGEVSVGGPSTAELDVVAESTAADKAIKWTRFDLTVIKGTKCHLHGLITPSSVVG